MSFNPKYHNEALKAGDEYVRINGRPVLVTDIPADAPAELRPHTMAGTNPLFRMAVGPGGKLVETEIKWTPGG